MPAQPTIQDVLDVLRTFSSHMDERFNDHDRRFDSIDEKFKSIDARFEAIDQRFDTIEKRFEAIDTRFDAIDKRFDLLERRVTKIEVTMVTKDYLDIRLVDLKSDLIAYVQTEIRHAAR